MVWRYGRFLEGYLGLDKRFRHIALLAVISSAHIMRFTVSYILYAVHNPPFAKKT